MELLSALRWRQEDDDRPKSATAAQSPAKRTTDGRLRVASGAGDVRCSAIAAALHVGRHVAAGDVSLQILCALVDVDGAPCHDLLDRHFEYGRRLAIDHVLQRDLGRWIELGT